MQESVIYKPSALVPILDHECGKHISKRCINLLIAHISKRCINSLNANMFSAFLMQLLLDTHQLDSGCVHTLLCNCSVLGIEECIQEFYSIFQECIQPHSNIFHWTRAVGYIGAYPTVLYFLSYITLSYFNDSSAHAQYVA